MPISLDNRRLSLNTPLGKEVLVIERLVAREAISELYEVELDLLREETNENDPPSIQDPKKLIGQPMSVTAFQDEGETADIRRYFHGICVRFSQGNRDARYTSYRAVIVPRVWLLTKNHQSRIFQQKNIPDILKAVLKDFDVKWELQGTFEPRNFCVQYRESDWDFASRLMEEEGIYYYFQHSESGHQMIVANTPQSHKDAAKPKIPFITNIGGVREDWQGAVNNFTFVDQLQTGKYTLWDHHFELVGKKLEAQQVSRFSIGGNDKLELYDYPGEYAQRFDGVSKGGGDQAAEIQKIFNDNKRTVGIRQGELDVAYKSFYGSSDSCAIVPGFKFEMLNHPHDNYNGSFLIVSSRTEAHQNPSYISGETIENDYIATFTGLGHGGELGTPFRPSRKTEKPTVLGTQTAVVVGPSGEEIFTDKYGRVKVQFHWDREGQNNESSSCWMRVAQMWAGKKWGTMFIPRIGMEVLVDFLEGDPDRPIIIGALYNAENMPPYTLPDEKTKSTIKSNSSKGGGGFNEIRIEDKKGSEQIFIHAEKDMDVRVKNDKKEFVQNEKHTIVKSNQFSEGGGNNDSKLSGNSTVQMGGSSSMKIGGDYDVKVGGKTAIDSGGEIHLKAGMKVVIEAGVQVSIKAGGSFVDIGPGGVTISGPMIKLNSGGAAGSGSGATTGTPTAPKEADKNDPGQSTQKPPPPPAGGAGGAGAGTGAGSGGAGTGGAGAGGQGATTQGAGGAGGTGAGSGGAGSSGVGTGAGGQGGQSGEDAVAGGLEGAAESGTPYVDPTQPPGGAGGDGAAAGDQQPGAGGGLGGGQGSEAKDSDAGTSGAGAGSQPGGSETGSGAAGTGSDTGTSSPESTEGTPADGGHHSGYTGGTTGEDAKIGGGTGGYSGGDVGEGAGGPASDSGTGAGAGQGGDQTDQEKLLGGNPYQTEGGESGSDFGGDAGENKLPGDPNEEEIVPPTGGF